MYAIALTPMALDSLNQYTRTDIHSLAVCSRYTYWLLYSDCEQAHARGELWTVDWTVAGRSVARNEAAPPAPIFVFDLQTFNYVYL